MKKKKIFMALDRDTLSGLSGRVGENNNMQHRLAF